MERCDVAVLMIDATEGITEQDAKIAGIAHDKGKAMIIAVSKWDAIEKNDKTIYEYQKDIDTVLSYMPYAQKVFISPKPGSVSHSCLKPLIWWPKIMPCALLPVC